MHKGLPFKILKKKNRATDQPNHQKSSHTPLWGYLHFPLNQGENKANQPSSNTPPPGYNINMPLSNPLLW